MKKFIMVTVALLFSIVSANMLFAALPDRTPDPFTFTDQTNVALNTPITSNAITVSGINTATPISVVGGTYSINGGAYRRVKGTVIVGSTVSVKLTSSGSYSTIKTATLTIGRVSDTFSVTTLASPSDTTPDPFTFTDQTNVALNTPITSNTITVSGITAAVTISITGGSYAINGGTYTSASGTVVNGNTVSVKLTSSGSYSTPISATLTIGGVSGTFSVTTLAASGGDYTSPNIGTLKYVPAGSFQRDNHIENISTVTTPFRMSQYEITRAQFLAIMGTDPSYASYSTGMTNPVQMTNWYHAIAFCNKLSIAEGLTPVYSVTGVNFATLTYAAIPTSSSGTWDEAVATWSNNGYRLPTEMEWEWAAMGATNGSGWTNPTYLTGYGKPFSGSDSILANGSGGTHVIGDYAWTSENSGVSQPVGAKLFNELGLYDMSGNVYEWCWDWWVAYPEGALASDTDAGRGAASGTTRIMRGGSWHAPALDAAVALRYIMPPHDQYVDIGFRVVRP
jgi:formylglycine-generating enzyme required for sulfatase activity